MIQSFGYFTKKGYQSDNQRKPNQDSVIVMPDFCKIEKGYMQGKIHLFGICDGHGKDGKEVSQFITTNLPQILKPLLASGKDLYQSIMQTIEQVEKQLIADISIDTDSSGTT